MEDAACCEGPVSMPSSLPHVHILDGSPDNCRQFVVPGLASRVLLTLNLLRPAYLPAFIKKQTLLSDSDRAFYLILFMLISSALAQIIIHIKLLLPFDFGHSEFPVLPARLFGLLLKEGIVQLNVVEVCYALLILLDQSIYITLKFTQF